MSYLLSFLALLVSLSSALFAQDTGWVAQTSNTLQALHGIAFVNANMGWAVGDSGTILRSTSSGATWAGQPSGTTQALTSVDFINASTGFAVGGCPGCTDGIILKTTDGGASWTTKDSGRNLFSVKFVSKGIAWATGANGLILKTTDSGETWAEQVSGSISCLETVYFINDTTGWIAGVLPGALLKTTNGGSSWESETNGIDPNSDIDAVFFVSTQIGWLSGYGFGDTSSVGIIKKTTDGGSTWVNQQSGTNNSLLSLGFIDAAKGWAAGSGGTLLRTVNGGTSWAAESSGTFLELDKIVVRAGEGGWIAGINGGILRKNFGPLQIKTTLTMDDNWNMICVPLGGNNNSKRLLFPTSVSPAFLYDAGLGYQRDDSLDIGRGYWLKFNGLQDVDVAGFPIDSLKVNLVPGWNLVGGITSDVQVSHIVQNPPNSILAVFGYNSSYFPSTMIEHGRAYWMKASGSCQITFYATLSNTIPSEYLTDVSRLRRDELPPKAPDEPAAEKDARSLPAEFSLDQNYPNPFNPVTVINYGLPEASNVRLSVYNILGQEVATLINGEVGAGYQSVEWNTDNSHELALPSGIYLYRILAISLSTAKEFTKTEKMVLMK